MMDIKIVSVDPRKMPKELKAFLSGLDDMIGHKVKIKKEEKCSCDEKRCDGDVEGKPKDLTFGDKMVGLDFNPSKNEKVALIKGYYAAIIDLLNDFRLNSVIDENVDGMTDIAIKEAMTAQMWAVKAVTFK